MAIQKNRRDEDMIYFYNRRGEDMIYYYKVVLEFVKNHMVRHNLINYRSERDNMHEAYNDFLNDKAMIADLEQAGYKELTIIDFEFAEAEEVK